MSDLVLSQASHASTIVGVGASAGGLEAFTQLLRLIPEHEDLSFVLIQHLDPTHPSTLRETLTRSTTMPVHDAEQGMSIESGHVYVITPNTELTLRKGALALSPRPTEAKARHLPIDAFLCSLAAERGQRAIGVLLSGLASDGTEGLRAIRAAAGITYAQAPSTAKFTSMPQSAIDAGVVDNAMPIPELAADLLRLSQHPYVSTDDHELEATDESMTADILAHVLDVTGTDFSEFKPATVSRRLARRLALRGVADLRSYRTLLDREPAELRALHEDVLIHVTSFFRDPDVYDALRAQVLPELLKHKSDNGPLRIWVAGCSSGEEVYSLAITLLELTSDMQPTCPLQLFGSDVSEVAIEAARAGLYNEYAMRSVSAERRRNYFVAHEHGMDRIQKRVRDLCVFVVHDLVRDPPFSKLDLVSCRNVLIYFGRELQKRVLPIFHYCLNQPGFLLLGRSENIVGFEPLFYEVDKAKKIFKRSANVSSLRFAPRAQTDAIASPGTGRTRGSLFQDYSALIARQLDQLLLARYSPPGVLVKENMEVVLFRGQTGAYLQAAPGQPQNNLTGMASGSLSAALREAIARAKRDRTAVHLPRVELDRPDTTRACDIAVIPFVGPPNMLEELFIVLFEEHPEKLERGAQEQPIAASAAAASDRRRTRLEHELSATKAYQHIMIEEHGRTVDELGCANEELVSGNEELQSLNEELEAAKEELQSSNEELTTLNDELQRRNIEIGEVSADLMHFSLAVDIAILRIDMERRIRRFTPKARTIFNISVADIGRVLDEVVHNLVLPDLRARITQVIESRTVVEFEVEDLAGRWHRIHIRPYTTTGEQVEGAIVSLVDIHELKRLVGAAERARAQAEQASSIKDDFLATLSHELRTPLSSMLLNAQRLREGDIVDQAGLKRAGDSLERAVQLQAKLIDDLLDVSRIAAGKLTLECRAFDLSDLVRVVVEGMKPVIDAKQLQVKLSLARDLTPVWADPTRTQQVIANLLSNAIKFTPRLGHITLTVDAAEGVMRLRITDTGIGISPDFLPRAFTHFAQSDRSITRAYGGLGLGLALVRHLVEKQGGNVHAHSPGVDRGATFTVTFPFARATDAPEPDPATPRPLDRPGRMKQYEALVDVRVLFIDDDFRTREAVLEVLELTGARVALATSVADGMSALETFDPHVIVCDIAMPGEDGYAFIRKLRARELGRDTTIPVLALTALASVDDKRRALAAGFQLHLAKPIDIAQLRDSVLELVGMRVQTQKEQTQVTHAS